ncbi:MAG: hydroxyacid dehydrogenase [Caldisericia bacterium]|nr:hydroxyacid dehydrogenase [Caldisericia bacterium]MDD4615145.1 hydroxyacid dehydrogenase [Caldisericia bacterium]
MKRILIADPLAKEGVEQLKSYGIFEVVEKTDISPEDLKQEIGQYNAVVVRSRSKILKETLEQAGNLELIVRGGVGTDNIDKATAKEKNIAVKNTPLASSISVAELVIGMALAGVRGLADATASTKKGLWEKKRFKGLELYGKTLGIIGLGNIGKETAKRAVAFGMKVLAYDPIVTSCAIDGVTLTTLEKINTDADILSVNCPKTDSTCNLIDASFIAKMKDGAGIINCSRGGIIVENDLVKALQSGKISFAGIDVYEKEPAKENPLFALENVVLTPHIGAQTKEGQTRVGVEVASVIHDFFQ